jgi:hypothetical protein
VNIESRKSLPILLSAVVAISISGCAEKRQCNTSVAAAKKVVKLPDVVKVQDQKDKQIHALELAILDARKNAGKTVTKVVEVAGESSPYPPNAQPGKCYTKVLIPAKYEVQTEKVLASQESETLTIIPAKYTMVSKKILAKEASEKLVAVPATYKTVTEKVLVKEASERLVKIPATYQTLTEKILLRDAYTTWKKGCNGSGECGVYCLVRVPAKYKTVTKRILSTPESTKSIPIPAKYRTVTRKVLDRPATTKSVPIPAVYKTVKIRELVEPASVKRTPIPARYQTITKKIKVSDSALKWEETVCKDSMTTINIRSVQSSLKSHGFNPGPIDGIFGWRTRAALEKYQRANSLATGALTQETLQSLGI